MTLKTHRAAMRAGFEQEIIAVASEEFAKHGVEDFSLRKLAAKMDCAVGTLYLYFDDKQQLLHAVVESGFSKLLETVQALPATGDPLETLRTAFHAYVEFGLKYPNHYRCAFALPSVAKSKNYRPHAAFDFLREKVRLGVKAGVFRSNDVDLVSQVIWVSVHGLTSLLIARPHFPWAPRKKLIDTLSETVLAGLFVSQRKVSGKK